MITPKQKTYIEKIIKEIQHRQNLNLISYNEKTFKTILNTLQEIIDTDDGNCAYKIIGMFEDARRAASHYEAYNKVLNLLLQDREKIINS